MRSIEIPTLKKMSRTELIKLYNSVLFTAFVIEAAFLRIYGSFLDWNFSLEEVIKEGVFEAYELKETEEAFVAVRISPISDWQERFIGLVDEIENGEKFHKTDSHLWRARELYDFLYMQGLLTGETPDKTE